MRVLVFLSIFAGITLAGHSQPFWQNTLGVVPLHSTRKDVERLYGVSTDSCRCNFAASQGAIHVEFASAPCVGPTYGWNVPKDTVLKVTFTPKTPLRYPEMAADVNGFVKRNSPGDAATTYYTNVDKGRR